MRRANQGFPRVCLTVSDWHSRWDIADNLRLPCLSVTVSINSAEFKKFDNTSDAQDFLEGKKSTAEFYVVKDGYETGVFDDWYVPGVFLIPD
jgi:hypothetical protein